jgi:hypothetical protein
MKESLMKDQQAVQKAEVAEEKIELEGKAKATSLSRHAPRVAIVGWCDRAARIEGPHPAFTCTNIQGLTSSRVSHLFPLSLQGTTLIFGIYNPKPGESFAIEFRHSDGTKAFDFAMSLTSVQIFEHDRKGYIDLASPPASQGWYFQTIQIPNHVPIKCPDTIAAFLKSEEGEQLLGSFNLLHASVPPYSADQVAALRSDPMARRIVRIAYSCTECGGRLQTYAALERNKAMEEQGWLWFAELDEEFRCICGNTSFSLQYLRTGLHGLLSRSLSPDDQAAGDFMRLYEKTKLEDDCQQFKSLIDQNVAEEKLQAFLEEHPIFFARFSASRLIPKPKIMLKYVADFAILNQRKELLLIEIEKAGIRLLTKEHQIAADLQHAVTQVTHWIQEVSDHKAAVLNSHEIELKEVAVVRGVVIAGRSPSDDEEARALRGAFSGNVDFYTYDDLLRDTTEIIRRIANA